MKLIKDIPKKFFKSRKSRSVSRSDEPYSFSSGTTSSESSESSSSNDKSHASLKSNGLATPTSVLPSPSPVRDEGPEISANLCFELVEAFKLSDRDGDGKITTVELKALLSRVGAEQPSEEELTMMLSEVDRDGDGCVSLRSLARSARLLGHLLVARSSRTRLPAHDKRGRQEWGWIRVLRGLYPYDGAAEMTGESSS
ncbi:unnamed protein product [Ilex paraguariensis]|uniref:EF-hand domain-containing protein n=1 Tax=Ilex paraguariensis TaxID=185542 RepID=A0ABC8S5P4_9AQUA